MNTSPTSPAPASAVQRWWTSDASRHGLQLATAVVIAYLVSAALGLPESLWAVMSVLIVMRPTTGSTVGAGWDRIRGTLIGSGIALAGVWARHRLGLDARWLTLGVVALMAYGSATRPAMRSAPITALIVLNSSGIGDLSAMHVAVLRAVEVGIGIVVGWSVSWLGPNSRAVARFDHACAGLLRDMAAQVRATRAGIVQADEDQEAAATRQRVALRQLAELGMSADREERMLKRRKTAAMTQRHLTAARLMSRTSHDVMAFGRLHAIGQGLPPGAAPVDWERALLAVETALTNTAEALAESARTRAAPDLSMIRSAPYAPNLSSALQLLRQDLTALNRLRGLQQKDKPAHKKEHGAHPLDVRES